jgi:cell division protein FtsL
MRSGGGLLESTLIGGRTIDNSQVVREVDPRERRDLWAVLLVVLALAVGLGVYAWPHYAAQRTSVATERLQRERERLVDENRKLRLEKASLEDLRRVEKIATEKLGLQAPAPERVVVIERLAAPAEGARLARHTEGGGAVE